MFYGKKNKSWTQMRINVLTKYFAQTTKRMVIDN
jgi:hypothetical protein